MAKKLTEEMVIARTKISDLSKIKRLNCWGSELVDVSLLRRMPCVEVLSLSINKINSLADFQACKRLEELYIRQNDIRDINEVVYLQDLTNLKNLWLGENPCAFVEGYRLSVIKALPQLQKLDNIQVTQDELRDAQRKGRTLSHPEEAQESDEDYISSTQQQGNRYQDYSESEYSPVQRSSPPQEMSPPRRTEPVRQSFSPEYEQLDRRRSSYDRESPRQTQYYDRSSLANNSFEEPANGDSNFRELKIVSSQSTSCIKEFTNGDRYVPSQQVYRQNEDGGNTSPHGHEKRERYSCPAASHKPPFNRRPVTRNSNILSAVLCLVKELDYPSLEVVEMAVRCRMDELDE